MNRRILVLLYFIITLLNNSSYSQVNLNLGLVAHYPFSGNPNDASGNGHTGQLINGPILTADRFGVPNSAYHFDGIDDYIRIPDNGAFSTSQISIAFWYKTESSSLQNIIAKRKFINDGTPAGGAQYQFFINHATLGKIASNLVGNTNSCTDITSSSYIHTQDLVCSDKWHFVVITFDGTTHKLYINGNLRTSAATSFTGMLNCPSEIRLGNWWQDDLIPFKGDFDDMRWYNRALNTAEIDFLYNNFQPPGNDWLYTPSFPSSTTVGDIDVTGNQITVEAVFNRTAPLNSGLYWGHLVSKHSGTSDVNYALLPNGCEITTDVSGYKVALNTCLPEVNKTYHVAMVYDGNSLKFYQNGFMISATACTGNLINNNLQTTIAQLASGAFLNNQFLGYVNEVRIWNVARSQSEIRTYMSTSLPSPTTQTGLLAYYRFNDLNNKQANAAFNGILNSSAAINQTNTACTYLADSCFIPPCPIKSDFAYQRDPCSPLSVSFQTPATSHNSISWDFGDGSFANATTTPSHIYSAFGTYQVTMIQVYANCADTIKKQITVDLQTDNQLIITPDTTICYGSVKQLRTQPSLRFCWAPSTYLNNPNLSQPITSTPHNITYYYTAEVLGNNLVVNGSFTTGNTGFTSQYSYATPNLLEAQYYVSANPNTWNGGMNNCPDHTTGNGNMMLVNGSPNAADKIWTQTISVTPNTNYAFATWIQSLNNVNPANLKFSINNTVVGNNITASFVPCQWNQFYVTWNSGNNTTAAITIVNNNTIALGNDFALDDISFAPVFLKRDSVIIRVDTAFVRTSNDSSVCSGNPVQLNTIGASGYSWSPATNLSNPNIANPIATPLTTTQYIVTGTTLNGCSAKDTVTINVFPSPAIAVSNDTTICKNTSVQLFASGGLSYSWTPASSLNNSQLSNPVATPAGSTKYFVTVSDGSNCTATDSIMVLIKPDPIFIISPASIVCETGTVQLNASGGDIYSWQPAVSLSNTSIANPIASPLSTTTYTVTITESICNKSATLSTQATVVSLPNVQATKSNDIDCSNDFSQLNATGAATYLWQPVTALNNASIADPIARPITTTDFIVLGKDLNGCENVDTIQVKVTNNNRGGYLMPSGFTPNNDGRNDCYGIKLWGIIYELEFTIYNRWGEKVFYTTNPQQCWNGTYNGIRQDAGVFIYMIKAKTSCESTVFRKGTFVLIR